METSATSKVQIFSTRPNKWPVGKVVNTSACHAEEHRFDPGTGRHYNAMIPMIRTQWTGPLQYYGVVRLRN